METHMIVRLVLGLLITVVALAIAARRVVFLARMVAATCKADGHTAAARSPGRAPAGPAARGTLVRC